MLPAAKRRRRRVLPYGRGPTRTEAACRLQRMARRLLQRRPVNDEDPITLERRPRLGYFAVASSLTHRAGAPAPVLVGYDPYALRRWLECDSPPRDPLTRRMYTAPELRRLAHLTGGAPVRWRFRVDRGGDGQGELASLELLVRNELAHLLELASDNAPCDEAFLGQMRESIRELVGAMRACARHLPHAAEVVLRNTSARMALERSHRCHCSLVRMLASTAAQTAARRSD